MISNLEQALRISTPGDLGPSGEVVIEADTALNWSASARYGFDFHWLRELAGGILEGDFGLKVDAGAEANLRLALGACMRAVVTLDEQGWLRLRFFKATGRGFGFASSIRACGQAVHPMPRKADKLLAALVGLPEAESLLETGLESFAGYKSLPRPVRSALGELFGTIRTEEQFSRLLGQLRPVLALRDAIYEKALTALEKKYTAELSCRFDSLSENIALVDCSFAFTGEGLSLYRQALRGELSPLFTAGEAHARLRHGQLAHGLRRQTLLELHLPFFDKRQWKTRLEALARLEVEAGEDGHLMVYSVDASHTVEDKDSYQSALALAGGILMGRTRSESNFTLSYTYARKLAAPEAAAALAPLVAAYGFDARLGPWLEEAGGQADAGELEAGLALEIPGRLVSAWLETPPERSSAYFPTFARVSVAVQRAARAWLPFIYFSGVERYENLEAAFPLVVYQASQPFPGKPSTDFTYDVMDRAKLRRAVMSAARTLPGLLGRIERLLAASGRTRTAGFYAPAQAERILTSVLRDNRLFKSLLAADASFVGALMKLANRGRKLREELERSPQAAVKNLSEFAEDFVKAFHGRLRRLYGGQEFPALGSLLLVEATSALGAAAEPRPGIRAKLSLKRPDGRLPLAQTFVNQAWQLVAAEEASQAN